jgi:hypothetical protein
MNDTDYLSLQANVICLLLFILGTMAIFERPEWFYWGCLSGALVMRKLLVIAILLVSSLASAGALELQGFALSVGGMGIVAPVRDDGRYANSPLKSWFDRLASGKGLCCSFADGLRVDDVDWDTEEGHYRVRLYGEWIVVPDNAVVSEPNKFGPAVVWPYMGTDGQTQIRCFLPGAGA